MPFDVPNIIFSFTMASEWCITLPLSKVTIGFYDEALCTLLLANSQQKEQVNVGVGQQGEKTRDSKWQADKKPPDKQAPTLNTTVCLPHLNIIHIVFSLITFYFQH